MTIGGGPQYPWQAMAPRHHLGCGALDAWKSRPAPQYPKSGDVNACASTSFATQRMGGYFLVPQGGSYSAGKSGANGVFGVGFPFEVDAKASDVDVPFGERPVSSAFVVHVYG